MKNIAIIVGSLTMGGAERIAGQLSIYLSAEYNLYLFMRNTDEITYDYKGTIVSLCDNGEDKVEQTLSELKNKYDIDCSISFTIGLDLLNIRTRGKDKIIITNHSTYGKKQDLEESTIYRINKWYGKADKIISCSYGAGYDLVHNFDVNEDLVTVIYNFIDRERIMKDMRDTLPDYVKAFAGVSKLLLSVGRLEKAKNHHKLLMQFSKLINEGYDVKLLILGSGNTEEELKCFTKQLDIEDRVLFVDYCKNPFPYYKLADVLAVSSDWEGLPTVILEAMTLGLPVVSTDCLSGPLELIKGCTDYSKRIDNVEICERGVLVTQKDSDNTGETAYFAHGVKLLLENDRLCKEISDNQIEYMKTYDNNKIFESWVKTIESINTGNKAYLQAPLDELKKENKVIVYGAGVYGKRIMNYILKQNWEYELLCFAVTDKSNNPEKIDSIPVYQLDELLEHRDSAMVVIGVIPVYEKELKDNLDKYKFRYIYSDL